ncbi:MAG: hypothetical protein ACNS62_18150 [Candidatus Cyclobacteriaceae bacterium M3_2C_046]
MKKLFYLIGVFSFMFFFTMISCNDEDEDPQGITFDDDDISGNWTILSFIDDGQNIVSDFPTKAIQIGPSGSIFFPQTGFFGGYIIEENGTKLDIEINTGGDPYDEFDDDWAVVELSETIMVLRDYDAIYDDDSSDDTDDDSAEEVRLERIP